MPGKNYFSKTNMMLKAELRKLYKQKRNHLSEQQIQEFSRRIFERFSDFFPLKEGDKIHVFLSIPTLKEVETDEFVALLFERKCRVFVPKIQGNRLVSIEIFPDTHLATNSWGIREPEEHSDAGDQDFRYVITPLLYCDTDGKRVGYGKGFYDGFFREISASASKIGVCFFHPSEAVGDIHADDIPLDYLVTPDTVLSFNGLP